MVQQRTSDHAQETAPLLAEQQTRAKAALPWSQLVILCYARISEAWLFFTILPYIAQMVEDTGIEHTEIGFYAGLIESVFSVFQLLTMQFIWVKASDKHGRKPVLVISLFGTAVAATAFGFSTKVWQMILSRAICGCFSGSIVVIRCMLSEISTDETRGSIFSYFALTGSLSSLLAPLAGGLLARPADRFPMFRFHLLISYPYLLPSLLAGGLPASAAFLSVTFLRETLPPAASGQPRQSSSIWSLLKAPALAKLLIVHNSYSFVGFSWMAITPVFWYTKITLGGLGLTTREIAWFMSVTGVFQAVMSICANPVVYRRYGTRGILRLSNYGLLANLVFQPLLHLVRETWGETLLVTLLPISVVLSWVQMLAFFGLTIAITEVAPSPQALGSTVSLFLANATLMRAFAPALATSILAYGIDRHVAGGQLVWIVLGLCTAVLGTYIRTLPNFKELKDSRDRQSQTEAEETHEA